MMRVSVVLMALVCGSSPLVAEGADPALALRLEAGGAGGFSDEVSEHGLAVHFGARLTYQVVSQLAAGVRVSGSFFPPAGTSKDISHAAYQLGFTARPAAGFWADGYVGLHDTLEQSGFGFDLGAGYDLALSSGAGLGPFVGYSFAAVDETQQFVQFGVGGTFGLPGPALARANDTRDPDGDSLTGDDDQCMDEAEDVDQFADDDGCPDPDNDGDRILDANDECRNEAEDEDQHQDDDGCPDPDNDSDGVLDASDRCAAEAEDRDQFQDDDGCPDPDNDADGVADAADECPNEPEDLDGWQDDNGCPEPDNDGDGKADVEDSCPNEPQTGTSTDGCPQRVRVGEGGVQLLESIRFRGANLDAASNGILDDLAAILRAPNAPQRIGLAVHLHPAGATAALESLSQRRADAIKAALVQRQVSADRIDAVGQGGQGPVAPGQDAAARRQNERVVVTFAR